MLRFWVNRPAWWVCGVVLAVHIGVGPDRTANEERMVALSVGRHRGVSSAISVAVMSSKRRDVAGVRV